MDIERVVDNIMQKAVGSLADRANPIYRAGETLGTLMAAQDEMKQANLIGGDNYYHRLGMCLNAQEGADRAAYSLGLGLAKEALWDYPLKTLRGTPQKEILEDSLKDMKNNYEGIIWGLQNPEKSCKIWLKDLDINTNEWKR